MVCCLWFYVYQSLLIQHSLRGLDLSCVRPKIKLGLEKNVVIFWTFCFD
uniref:Uncharacterized protein n=1 Tax=Rhizophora mucronata TaxID=61149 RepID=A0A2P2P3P9_RHIMU